MVTRLFVVGILVVVLLALGLGWPIYNGVGQSTGGSDWDEERRDFPPDTTD